MEASFPSRKHPTIWHLCWNRFTYRQYLEGAKYLTEWTWNWHPDDPLKSRPRTIGVSYEDAKGLILTDRLSMSDITKLKVAEGPTFTDEVTGKTYKPRHHKGYVIPAETIAWKVQQDLHDAKLLANEDDLEDGPPAIDLGPEAA